MSLPFNWMNDFQASHEAFVGASGEPAVRDEQAWVAFAENVKKSRVPSTSRVDLRWLVVLALALALAAGSWAAWHYVLQSRLR
jgi:hypothetical protein